MAPEILVGQEGTDKVDIWAAGILAFYLFTGGRSPFPQECEDSDSYDDEDKQAMEQ